MTKIKNNGNKIVHIGKTILMPGNEIAVNSTTANTPAIKILIKNKILTATEEVESETTDTKIKTSENSTNTAKTVEATANADAISTETAEATVNTDTANTETTDITEDSAAKKTTKKTTKKTGATE